MSANGLPDGGRARTGRGTWFTADTHFGHEQILAHMPRPWASVEEMDDALVSNWNAHVRPDDIVWHLGDFAFRGESPYTYARRLNGNIFFVIGNHDAGQTDAPTRSVLREVNADGVFATKWLKQRPYGHFWLSHYAHRVWPRSHFGSYHLYGHSHGDLPGVRRSMDVGVDAIALRSEMFRWERDYAPLREPLDLRPEDYRPVGIDEVVEALESQPYSYHHEGMEGAVA